jgi:hypothetical protein
MRTNWRRRFGVCAVVATAMVVGPASSASTPHAPLADLLAVSVSAQGAASLLDVTTATGGSQVAATPMASAINGSVATIAATTAGGVVLAPTLSQLPAPPAIVAGSPALTDVVDVSALVALGPTTVGFVARTSTGDLLLATSTTGVGGAFSVTDLAAALGSTTVAATPTLRLNAAGEVEVVATTSTGAIVDVVADGFGGHRWNAYNLSSITGIAPIVGTAAVATDPGDGSSEVLVAKTTTGRLVALTDDDAAFTLWRAVPIALPSGDVVATAPALAATATGLVGVVATTTGGLVVLGASTGAGPWTTTEWTASLSARRFVASAGTVGVVATSGGFTVALRAASGHLVELQGTSPTVPTPAIDVSDLAGVGELVAGDVNLVATPTGLVAVALDGGATPLVQRIVALAKSKDQFGSAVEETPINSNCNPYTAAFGRGSTSGCAKGTAAEEWCSDFAEWVWMRSGADVSGITGYSYTFVDHGQRLATFKAGATNNPRPGDAVVWGYASTHVGDHVGLVVAVKGNLIDVVSGNSGPPTPQGYNVAVWDSGFFDPSTSRVSGSDSIVGYITPTLAPPGVAHVVLPKHPGTKAQIAAQDGGR